MTDPRLDPGKWSRAFAKNLTFIIDDSTITYLATANGGSSQVGLAVRLNAAGGVIETVADGEFVLGELISVESDGAATVQVGGMCKFKGGTGAALTLGEKIVGDLLIAAEGYVRAVASGTAAELAHARGMIMDASDTDEVAVWMG